MDKFLGLLVDQITTNKRANSLFALLAGAIAVWALNGGASNLFDGSTVRDLQKKAVVQVKVLAECKAETEKVKKENNSLKSTLVDVGQQHTRELESLRAELSDLKAENLLLKGQNDILKLMLSNSSSGNVPTLGNNLPTRQPEGTNEPHPQ